MAENSKARGPIPNYELSTCVQHLEERFADLEHEEVKEWTELQRVKSELAHWKELYTAAQDKIAEMKSNPQP